jgi:hypothetical protein
MQKNDKFYTFLLSHSSGSKIKIRRIAIRKASVQFGSLGIFAAVCLTTFGIGVGNILGNIAMVKPRALSWCSIAAVQS